MSSIEFPQGLRERPTLGYRSVVLTTIVNALRSVYTSQYYERQFQDLKVSGEYSLTKIDYPSIFVKFNSRKVRAAGVGHEEFFQDHDGIFRAWDHRYFEGTVEFKVVTLSPLDLDILLDSLTEIISFARLDDQIATFYYTIYGEPGTIQPFATQIAFNSDEIEDSGAPSVSPAPWQPEDVLMYQSSLMVDVMGGFYNIVPNRTIEFVWDVSQFPYLLGEEPINLTYRPDLAWSPPFEYIEDPSDSLVTGSAVPSATDSKSP